MNEGVIPLRQELVVGSSPLFRARMKLVESYAGAEWPVLLLGETGVGKEVIARRIHELSPRRAGLFLPVNCAAMPAGLFESELFGHERGAFSGAQQASRGLLRQASGGTVFLDEIGDLPLDLQVKLLRFLDSGEVRAVGSARVERAESRIVAATNVCLAEAVRHGRFRRDLFERLSVLRLEIPPLRHRKEDIVPLAVHFLDALGARYQADELAPLVEYEWPGNVRQLRNFLIRATIIGRSALEGRLIDKLLLEEKAQAGGPVGTPQALWNGSLAEIEKEVIVARLRRLNGNRKRTAKELGIAKSTLQEKLRRWREEPAAGGEFSAPVALRGPRLDFA